MDRCQIIVVEGEDTVIIIRFGHISINSSPKSLDFAFIDLATFILPTEH